MKTNLEIFNRVRDHLLKQGRRSTNDDGFCMYRAPNGDSCAVGCLILDEHHSILMENHTVSSLITQTALKRSGIEEDAIPMLAELQTVHDSTESWRNFPHNLNKELEQIRAEWCAQ